MVLKEVDREIFTIKILGSYGKGELLEPITKDFPQFGPGGATQAVTLSPIELLELIDLLKGDNYHE